MLRSCGTCRHRRRACDKARPTCGTCKKSGHRCDGYDAVETKVFVNFNSRNLTRRKKRVLCDAIRDQHELRTGSGEATSSSDETESASYFGLKKTSSAAPPLLPPMAMGTDKPVSYDPSLLLETDVRITLLNCLHMSVGAFHEHLSTLWNNFQSAHTMTTYGWAPSFGSLIMANRSLDLALVALGTLRLSQTGGGSRWRVMAHSAYDQSMRLFRRICDVQRENDGFSADGASRNSITPSDRRRAAMLSVTSLCYSFIEASHTNPVNFFTDGFACVSQHIHGCLLFVQVAEPKAFSRGGPHRAFRKIREMTMHVSLFSHEPSALAAKEWLQGPWEHYGKTIRDRLFDIVTELTILSAHTLGNEPKPFHVPRRKNGPNDDEDEERSTPIKLYRKLERDFHNWMSTWLSPSVHRLKSQQEKPALVDDHDVMLDEDNVLLRTEMRSVRLLMALVALGLSRNYAELANLESDSENEFNSELLRSPLGAGAPVSLSPQRAKKDAAIFAEAIRDALKLPVFNLQGQLDEGIVEGQCRSILPAMSLNEYDRVIKRDSELYEMPLDGLLF